MFNPATVEVPDSRGRLALRQWWRAILAFPLAAAILVSLLTGIWETWGSLGDMAFGIVGVLVFARISRNSFTEVRDKALVVTTALAGGLTGVLADSFVDYPPQPPRLSDQAYLVQWAPEVFEGDWFISTRIPHSSHSSQSKS